jgi:hypothetical protein
MGAETEQIAFTGCTFKECNIDSIDANEARGIVSKDNTFERPLDDQRKDFEERLGSGPINFLAERRSGGFIGVAGRRP